MGESKKKEKSLSKKYLFELYEGTALASRVYERTNQKTPRISGVGRKTTGLVIYSLRS